MSGYRAPATPALECKSEAGVFAPVVDPAKCEGKAECAIVCPFHVFEVRRMDDALFARLGPLAKVKSVMHGRQTAYTPLASACEACGKCVATCPESAITLVRVSPRELILREVAVRYGDDADAALRELDRYEGSLTADRDRVQKAILDLTDGLSLDNLRRWVDVAVADYRDVLGPAEYPTAVHADEVKSFNAWKPDEAMVAETSFADVDGETKPMG